MFHLQKNLKFRWVLLGLFLIVCLTALIYLLYTKRYRFKQRIFRYSNFGILLPADHQVHGIDVSRYQGSIDWNAVAAMNIDSVKLDFAFIRATQGVTYVDPYFKKNWQEVKNTRVVRGAYHYFNPDQDGLLQAENFISRVNFMPGDLPPVLDVEELKDVPPSQVVNEMREWIDRVQAHYKVKPIIYTFASFYNKYLVGVFPDHLLWVAHHYEPRAPRVRSNWVFWQHNNRGKVNGIGSDVDFNVFQGSRAALDSLCILTTMR
jgi:lysozyme